MIGHAFALIHLYHTLNDGKSISQKFQILLPISFGNDKMIFAHENTVIRRFIVSTWQIVLLVILAVLIIAVVALYFLGKKAQKKQSEQQAQIDAM